MKEWVRKNKKSILRIYLILVIGFIWGQSLLPGEESSSESSRVLEMVVHPIERALTGRETITEHQVRKAAHVLEYTALGFGLMLYGAEIAVVQERSGDMIAAGFRVLSAGMLIAFLDETIQIFTGRGPMIQDVWIDTFGVVQGMGIAVLTFRVFGETRRNE